MIDLNAVDNLLGEATVALGVLHGVEVTDANSTGTKRKRAADISRDLLHLADSLDLAAALVRQEYWRMKGHR